MNFNFGGKRIIVLLSIFIIVIGIGFTIYNWPECSEIKVIPMNGFVNTQRENYWGMDTAKDHLAFGGLSLGNTIKRSMMVRHNTNAEVIIRLSGDIASYVTAEPMKFEIHNDEEKQIDFFFSPPYGTPQGNYSGKVVYCFKEI